MRTKEKASGRACGNSILARNLATKLVEDGILDRPITMQHREGAADIIMYFSKSGYFWRGTSKWLEELGGEIRLWQPSFIPVEIWEEAVKSFRPRFDLKYNVEYYLLPLMPELENQLTDEKLRILVHDYLIECGVVGRPIRQISGDTYYFNQDEIYTLDKGSVLFEYEGRMKFHLFKVEDFTSFNMNVWSKAVKNFKVGTKLEDCVQVFLDTELDHKPAGELPLIEKLIQGIDAPQYERVPENRNVATFDRIRVTVGLPRYLFPTPKELKQSIKDNRGEIDRRVLQRIEEDRKFKKYGVPLNVLRLSNVILRADYALEYIFELKL